MYAPLKWLVRNFIGERDAPWSGTVVNLTTNGKLNRLLHEPILNAWTRPPETITSSRTWIMPSIPPQFSTVSLTVTCISGGGRGGDGGAGRLGGNFIGSGMFAGGNGGPGGHGRVGNRESRTIVLPVGSQIQCIVGGGNGGTTSFGSHLSVSGADRRGQDGGTGLFPDPIPHDGLNFVHATLRGSAGSLTNLPAPYPDLGGTNGVIGSPGATGLTPVAAGGPGGQGGHATGVNTGTSGGGGGGGGGSSGTLSSPGQGGLGGNGQSGVILITYNPMTYSSGAYRER